MIPQSTPTPPRPLAQEDLDLLLFLATCAPSVHNTQPWSFELVGEVLELSWDHSRRLTVIDPSGRQAVLSCGAALHHLVVAARGIGLDAAVTLLPAESPGCLAQVRLVTGPPATQAQVAQSVAVLTRHTYRERFTDQPVHPHTIDVLARAAESCSAMVRVVRPAELTEVEVLVSRAEQQLQRDPAYLAELEAWARHSAEDERREDGLSPAAVDHGERRAESLQGRAFDGLPLPRPPGDDHVGAEQNSVLLLTTRGDATIDWLHAGMALSAVLLEATARGLVAQPIGQVIDVPDTRWALRAALSTVGVPQMLLRIGYGSSTAATPRRAVADVLHRRAPTS